MDEQEIIPCGKCGVPILTWWAANGGGLLRGEYVLVGDSIFHPRCWDERGEGFWSFINSIGR